MSFILIAFVIGGIIGYARGGRFVHFAAQSFKAWPLLVLGAVLQTTGQQGRLFDDGYPLVLASYAVLGLFVFLNIRATGMLIVYIGLLLNFVVIGANNGMPISRDAARSAGFTDAEIDRTELPAKRHFADGDEKLMFLGDVIPLPDLPPNKAQVISIGDVVLALGLIVVVSDMMQPDPRRRPEDDDLETTDDPSADTADDTVINMEK